MDEPPRFGASIDSEEVLPLVWRAYAAFALAPVGWAAFHLWEQWPAFAGRDAWAARVASTSVGSSALALEVLLGVLPSIAWAVLAIALRREEPRRFRYALADDPALAARLDLLARACAWLFAAWLAYHVAWLWGPKLVGSAEPLRVWVALRERLGTWPHAAAHAIGLTAFAVHAAASIPRLALAFGWLPSASARRAARLSGLIVALGMSALFVQLAGLHAAGRGTLWSLEPASDDASDPDSHGADP
jgi:hypothetical protein